MRQRLRLAARHTATILVALFAALTAALLAVLGSTLPTSAHAQAAAPAFYEKLQRAGLLDAYFPEAVLELALPLAQAAPGTWERVQVNAPWRRGTLNIYLVDADRIRPEFSLADEGVPEFGPENLYGGALAHRASQTIFINTAASKRATATAVLQWTQREPVIKALARIDAAGLAASERLWSPATLNSDSKPIQLAVMQLRGAYTFVLAHEMGHLLAPPDFAAPPALQPQQLTARQKDERAACPELLRPDHQRQRAAESAADMAAVRLLGQQCRIGSDGARRHEINQLGMQWYFLTAMSDKMLQAGRRTQSPEIARRLQQLLGPELYAQVVVAPSAGDRKEGAVKPLFPASHPPDHERALAIEAALEKSPCGGTRSDHTLEQAMETLRLQMCRGLVATSGAR